MVQKLMRKKSVSLIQNNLNEFKKILSTQTPEERAVGLWMSTNMKGFG